MDIYSKAMQGAHSRILDATDGIFKQDTDKTTGFVRMGAGVKSGDLKRSVKNRKLGRMKYEIYIDGKASSYGAIHELGSKPHIIRPVRAKVLRFQVGGKTVFTKQVSHPGTKGTFFMKRGVERGYKDTPSRLINAYITVFKRMGAN